MTAVGGGLLPDRVDLSLETLAIRATTREAENVPEAPTVAGSSGISDSISASFR